MLGSKFIGLCKCRTSGNCPLHNEWKKETRLQFWKFIGEKTMGKPWDEIKKSASEETRERAAAKTEGMKRDEERLNRIFNKASLEFCAGVLDSLAIQIEHDVDDRETSVRLLKKVSMRLRRDTPLSQEEDGHTYGDHI